MISWLSMVVVIFFSGMILKFWACFKERFFSFAANKTQACGMTIKNVVGVITPFIMASCFREIPAAMAVFKKCIGSKGKAFKVK